MIKSLSLLTRKPELTPEEFRKVWVAEHAPMVRRVPGVRKYVLSFVIDEPKTANAPIQAMHVDAMAELWYDDVAALRRAQQSDELKAVLANGARYLGQIKTFITEEIDII